MQTHQQPAGGLVGRVRGHCRLAPRRNEAEDDVALLNPPSPAEPRPRPAAGGGAAVPAVRRAV